MAISKARKQALTAHYAEMLKGSQGIVLAAFSGTRVSELAKEGDPGYKSGSLSIDSLIKAAPGIEKLARLDGEQIASIGSQDMNDAVWFKLARRANELLAKPDVAGIVVIHGTTLWRRPGISSTTS